jgi:hypothetical protein
MKNELEEYQKEMAINRRIRQQAFAILQRAKTAGIPQSSLRIKEEKFLNMLDLNFFMNRIWNGKLMNKNTVEEFCHVLFTDPKFLLKIPFILIDGGDMYSRRDAGYALLFRIIAWDRNGQHYNCANVTHRLQIWDNSGESRAVFAESLKSYDSLFMSECANSLFKAALEAGSFFDEVLETRELANRPTIISFQNALPYKKIESREINSESSIGQYMMMFSEADDGKVDKDDKPCESLDLISKGNMLRIRVNKRGK